MRLDSQWVEVPPDALMTQSGHQTGSIFLAGRVVPFVTRRPEDAQPRGDRVPWTPLWRCAALDLKPARAYCAGAPIATGRTGEPELP